MGKSALQRQVLALRTLVAQALSDLEDSDGDGSEGAVDKLRQAHAKFCDLEVNISRTTERSAPALPMASLDVPRETGRWLLTEFQEVELEAAELSFEMTKGAVSRRRSSRSHGPDDPQDIHASPVVAAILEHYDKLDFDALALRETEAAGNQIVTLGSYLLTKRGNVFCSLREKGWISEEKCFGQAYLNFLGQLDKAYKTEAEVPYHNAFHATDVMATMGKFMRTRYIADHTLSLDYFMGITAAAVHDVGHPGTNALFHKKMMTDLSIRYNDKSPLENMHCSLAFELLKEKDCNWLKLLSKAEDWQSYVRHGIITMVLATDMKKHAKQLQKLTDLMAEGEQAAAEADTPDGKQRALDNKLVLLATALHAADLSNPTKPGGICLSWTKRVYQEYWNQGDQERLLCLQISPMCNRHENKDLLPQGQLGFIHVVLMPMYTPLAVLVDEIDAMKKQLEENIKFWEQQKEEKATFFQLFGEEA